jgi:two-component system, response regulator
MPERRAAIDILLVEDNPADAELCIHALRQNNLANHFLWVKDGAAALDVLLRTGEHAGSDPNSQPKVVLLDLRLPKVDGIEVLRRLRADARTRVIPVVVLTSSQAEGDVAEAYQLGANSFINKPVEFEVFADMIGKLGLYWLVVNKPVQ